VATDPTPADRCAERAARDASLLRLCRRLEAQPFNRSGADKTEVVAHLWGLIRSFQTARPVARSSARTRGSDAAVD